MSEAVARPWRQRLQARLGKLFSPEPESGIDALPVRVHGTEFARTAAAPVHVKGFDQPLVWVTFALLMFGLVMVYSASIALPDNPRMGSGYTSTYFLMRHAASLGIGFVAALLAFQVPLSTWERWAPWIFIVAIVCLILVLMPFIGKSVNGARRWIGLGLMNFQPSELAKLGVLLYAANYMVRKLDSHPEESDEKKIQSAEKFFAAVTPMAISVAIVGFMLLAEPDMGAFMVIAVIAMGILFLGQRAHVLLDCSVTHWRLRGDHRFVRMAPRAHLCLPRPLERRARVGQGVSAVAFAHRHWPRRNLWRRVGRQRREAALVARSAHRLLARRHR